jgi:hypothetical protein
MSIDLPEARAVLARTPCVLSAWLDDLPDVWLDANEGPDTFSPRDVIGHLISGEATDWVPRARLILEHGERTPFPPFDRFAFRTAIAGRPLQSLLDEFADRRAESLAWLDAFAANPSARELLQRAGTHPSFGRVTLGALLATWVAHDLTHLAQIARVMARRYQDDVGPWREYLGVLNWRS